MFLGTFTPKLDEKGRLIFPAKFRDELASGLVMTRGQEHCIASSPGETGNSDTPAAENACSSPDYRTGRVVAISDRAIIVADTTNPTSNRIYRRLGFEVVEDSLEILFSPR